MGGLWVMGVLRHCPLVTPLGYSHGGAAAPLLQPPLRGGRLVQLVGAAGLLHPPGHGEWGRGTLGGGGVNATLWGFNAFLY